MTLPKQRGRILYLLVTFALVLGGVVFWVSDLTSDPPTYYSGLGQSLSTDPTQYIFHARNKILFDEFDPFDYPRWTVYQHSLTSLVGYIIFSVTGVSWKTSNIAGIVLGAAGLIFLVLGLLKHHRPWVAAAVSLCFVINVTLLTHLRLPYLENGLIFWSGLLFLVYSWFGYRLWGIVVSGIIVALATFTGKLFGAVLIGALVLSIFYSDVSKRRLFIGSAVGSFVLGSLALVLALYGSDFMAAITYVGEQSYGLRGIPAGLQSPWVFLERFISYGFGNHLFYLDPDLWMFIVAGGIVIVARIGSKNLRSGSPVLRLSIFWIIFGMAGLAPLNYSPIRYTLLFIPAIIIFGFTAFDAGISAKQFANRRLGKLDLIVLCFILWFGLYHFIANFFYFNQPPARWLIWMIAPGAVALAFAGRYLLGRYSSLLTGRNLAGMVLVLLALSVTANIFRIKSFHYQDHNYNIAEANQDLSVIVGPDAVVSGPYGPVLTVDTNLKSFIHLFGVAWLDSTLFDRQPITHIAVDDDNLKTATESYSALQGLPPIATYFIRDNRVRLYNVSQLFGNREARSYQPTVYEQAMFYYSAERFDSAFAYATRFYQRYPESKSGSLLMCDLLSRQGMVEEAHQIFTYLADLYPTDFFIQIQCGRFIQMMAFQSKDRALMERARLYYGRGVRANRFRGEYAAKLFNEVQSKFRGP